MKDTMVMRNAKFGDQVSSGAAGELAAAIMAGNYNSISTEKGTSFIGRVTSHDSPSGYAR